MDLFYTWKGIGGSSWKLVVWKKVATCLYGVFGGKDMIEFLGPGPENEGSQDFLLQILFFFGKLL